jgi:hypothetical protein
MHSRFKQAKEYGHMRIILAIILAVLLSINLLTYSEELAGFGANLMNNSLVNSDTARQLKDLGYYKAEFKDEHLNFRNAVLRLQSESNIRADGIAGKQFNAALSKLLMQDRSTAYNDYISKPASNGLWIVVNKTNRTLTLYSNKTAIKKYPVALGRADYVTPEGKFKIKSKVVNPKWSGGGYAEPVNRWLGLTIGNKNKYGIHGNNNPYSIGQNVSRGCIRMHNGDIQELYASVKKNTPVWIGTDKVLRKWGVYQNSIIE